MHIVCSNSDGIFAGHSTLVRDVDHHSTSCVLVIGHLCSMLDLLILGFVTACNHMVQINICIVQTLGTAEWKGGVHPKHQ